MRHTLSHHTETKTKSQKTARPPSQTTVSIDLKDHPQVFRDIKVLAKEQIRPIDLQVIYLVEKGLKVADNRCKFVYPNGQRCKAFKMPGFDYCYTHDETRPTKRMGLD